MDVMRLVEIEFPYDQRETFKPTPEEFLAMNEAWVHGNKFELKDDGCLKQTWGAFLVDLDKMPAVPYELKRMVFNGNVALGLDTNTAGRPVQFNQKVNVAVPGLGLLLLNEVMVETDCCSDHLNGRLQEGWRIVAVCPQSDQRRPDYVLGRVKKDES